MIIQCEQCQTKFRLDDSRIKGSGVKVRCAKCKHVFTVTKDQPPAARPEGFGAILDRTPAFEQTSAPATETFAQVEESPPAPSMPDLQPSSPAPRTSSQAADFDFGAFEAPQEEAPTPVTAKTEPVEPAWSEPATFAAPAAEPAPSTPTGLEFGEVDFGASSGSAFADGAPAPSVTAAADEAPQQPEPSPFNQNFSDLFESTTVEPASPAAPSVTPAPAEQPSRLDAALSGEHYTPPQLEKTEKPLESADFIFSMPEPTLAQEPKPAVAEPAPQPVVQPASSAEPFPIPAATPQPKPEPAPPQPEPTAPAVEQAGQEPATEEMPPLSIPSRRKESALLKFLVPVLIVVAIAAAAFFGKDYIAPLLGQKPAQETGSITLRSINSAFVKNTPSGKDLLVISGEALNGYNVPRAALQVKGMVYGDKGQVLASKNAYCGNPLTAQQLASMPLEAIETTMANQLGSALSNLEVAPGKAVPFTVVISALPDGAKDFGVVPAGSQSVAAKPK